MLFRRNVWNRSPNIYFIKYLKVDKKKWFYSANDFVGTQINFQNLIIWKKPLLGFFTINTNQNTKKMLRVSILSILYMYGCMNKTLRGVYPKLKKHRDCLGAHFFQKLDKKVISLDFLWGTCTIVLPHSESSNQDWILSQLA